MKVPKNMIFVALIMGMSISAGNTVISWSKPNETRSFFRSSFKRANLGIILDNPFWDKTDFPKKVCTNLIQELTQQNITITLRSS